ncbi:MAG: DUF1566 domain-containing protein [Magnetococcales bacterium]|nr:DUF1566 domain-containing protein [Magnetococcales bacterium]
MKKPLLTLALMALMALMAAAAPEGGAAERFTEMNNGSVRDEQTGLTWMKWANCWGPLAWEEAAKAVAGLNAGTRRCEGYTGHDHDWRLPSRTELASLAGEGERAVALILPRDHRFREVREGHYWSGETASSDELAWYVNLHNGHVDFYNKQEAYFVWPVRGHTEPLAKR